MSDALASAAPRVVSVGAKLRQYHALTKPRVVQLIVFCASIGMLLASPGSGSSLRRRQPSTASSSSTSIGAWRGRLGAPLPLAS